MANPITSRLEVWQFCSECYQDGINTVIKDGFRTFVDQMFADTLVSFPTLHFLQNSHGLHRSTLKRKSTRSSLAPNASGAPTQLTSCSRMDTESPGAPHLGPKSVATLTHPGTLRKQIRGRVQPSNSEGTQRVANPCCSVRQGMPKWSIA